VSYTTELVLYCSILSFVAGFLIGRWWEVLKDDENDF
jgi:hypothetical protein